MTTLIAVYNKQGSLGKCDEQCYDAAKPGCNCICNGHNHGAGYAQAVKNTARYCAFWVHRDNFPTHVAPPTAVRLHHDVHATQAVLEIKPGPLYLMKRKPE